jgi:hypothetical protein
MNILVWNSFTKQENKRRENIFFSLKTPLCFLALSRLINFITEVAYISSIVYVTMPLSSKILIMLFLTQKSLKCLYFKHVLPKRNKQSSSYYRENTGVLHIHFPHPSNTLERNDFSSKKYFMEAIKLYPNRSIITSVSLRMADAIRVFVLRTGGLQCFNA